MATPIERLANRNGKKIAALLHEVVDACRAEGLREPRLFFEPESAAVFVMDGDHEHEVNCEKATAGQRQQAIVARIPVGSSGCPFDAGAW